MPNLRRVGREAEDRAADHLLSIGYTLVTRRYKTRRGEIDLVVLDGDTVVFVEVKERRTPGYVPEEAIGKEKTKMICAAAEQFMLETNDTRSVRFDVVAIDPSGLRHHIDAFRAGDWD